MKIFKVNNKEAGVGVEGVIYNCPNCNNEEYVREDTIQSPYMWIMEDNKTFTCSACGCRYGRSKEVVLNMYDN